VHTEFWWGKPRARARRRLGDNIKMNFQGIEWGCWTGWIWLV